MGLDTSSPIRTRTVYETFAGAAWEASLLYEGDGTFEISCRNNEATELEK
jgi:hypothetical protein